MRFDWNQPPGAPVRRSIPRSIKTILASFLVGVISIGVAWAGAGLVPASNLVPADKSGAEKSAVPTAEGEQNVLAETESFDISSIEAGQVLAGAAKVSIKPQPEQYGGTWERNYDKCATLPQPEAEEGYPERLIAAAQEGASHLADLRVKWHENSNCIYMGGYGLGPMFPIVEWDDEYGLWARAVAMSDGQQTVVLTLLDAVYWEGRYNSMCENCGFLDLAEQLATETGLPQESFVFASTHSHTAPDFIGGWGGVPRWYMEQVTESMKAAIREALGSMRPAVLETGETIARRFNGERRDFYRSAEDDGLSWFRLIAAQELATEEPTPEPTPTESPTPLPPQCKAPGQADNPDCQPAPEPTPAPTPTAAEEQPEVIATVGAYAAHPVTSDHESGIGDADFPAVFAKRLEEKFGGLGMFLQTGLGNMSPRGKKLEMGNGLATLVPDLGAGSIEPNPDVRVGRTMWNQPTTNVPLGALGAAGFFDRKFNELPATVQEGKGPQNKKCTSASPLSVDTSVSAAKIGSLWMTGAPGEIFANYSNTIEERNPNGVTLALGLVNDGLGYIIQSFETDHVGRQGAGFVGGTEVPQQVPPPAGKYKVGIAEYEDAYSIDHCFGDAALEKTLALLGTL